MDAFGWNRSRFTPAYTGWGAAPAGPRLGQAEAEWMRRAQEAVGKYGALLKRTGEISDAGVKAGILEWLGRPDVPGAPAERNRAVSEDLAAKVPLTEVSAKRVTDLEDAVREFEMRVTDAEATHGTANPLNQPVQTASPAGALTPAGFALGMVGILGLLVVPLLIE